MEPFTNQQVTGEAEYTEAMAEGAASGRGSPRLVTCVVWRHPDVALRPELLSALKRPGFLLITFDHAFDAFAAVVAGSTTSAQPIDRAPLVVLVIVQPHTLGNAHEMVQVVQRFTPSVVLWQFDPAEAPHQLRRVRAADVELWRAAGEDLQQPADPTNEPTFAINFPEVKPTGESGTPKAGQTDPASTVQEAKPAPELPRHILTDDELAMLLDAEPRETGEGPR